jgi:hypothetical protein
MASKRRRIAQLRARRRIISRSRGLWINLNFIVDSRNAGRAFQIQGSKTRVGLARKPYSGMLIQTDHYLPLLKMTQSDTTRQLDWPTDTTHIY